ncbi:MAG: lycopene cyclase domain-containing protein [Bacteroidota bacterium]
MSQTQKINVTGSARMSPTLASVVFGVGSMLLIALLWLGDHVVHGQFVMEVNNIDTVAAFETKYLYGLLHLIALIPVLALSFDSKVHYYTRWKHLFPAMAVVGALFILWDIYFTQVGVWEFNSRYYASPKLLSLPLEEWLFFMSIPFAVIFIYECWTAYIQKDWLASVEPYLTPFLIGLFLLVGFWHWGQIYTATTFLLTGLFLLYHYLYLPSDYRARFYITYLISCIPFLLINGVLTGSLTEEPVVIYNPDEYLGIRIVTVPLDDAIYSFLLILSNLSLYEYFKRSDRREKKFEKS